MHKKELAKSQQQLAAMLNNAEVTEKTRAAQSGSASGTAWGAATTGTSTTVPAAIPKISSKATKKQQGKGVKTAAAVPAPVQKTKPMSFMEIQKMDEAEAKRKAAAQKAAGGAPATGWAAAAGAPPPSSGFTSPGKGAATGSSGGTVWGGSKSASAVVAASAPQAKSLPPKPQPTAVPVTSAPSPKKSQAKTPAPAPAAGGGFWDVEEPAQQQQRPPAAPAAAAQPTQDELLVEWCTSEMRKLPKSDIDTSTFIELLKSAEERDVTGYLYEYFGNAQAVTEFARNFVDRRSGKGWETAGGSSKGGDGKPSGKSKKKKKKGQKMDPSMLTYGVNSTGGANRGEIDTWQTAAGK